MDDNWSKVVHLVFESNSIRYMSVTKKNRNIWVAFNLGTIVLQYIATSSGDLTTLKYRPQNNFTIFTRIEYSTGHDYLYLSTNWSQVQKYSCDTGRSTDLYFNPIYRVDVFDSVYNGYIALLNYGYIIKFTSTTDFYSITYSQAANTFAASYKDSQFVYLLGNSRSSSCILVHYGDETLGQLLNYTGNVIMAIDATENYIALVDVLGFLVISSYQESDNHDGGGVPGWVIALIVTLIVLAFIVGGVVKIIKGRKKEQANKFNNYNKFNNDPIPQRYISNQPSGQQTSSNNFNTNPVIQSNKPCNSNQPSAYINTSNQLNQQTNNNPMQLNQSIDWQ